MLFFCSRVGVVKAASYAASWTLSKASQETYWKLYHVSIEQIFSRYSIFIMFIVTDLPHLPGHQFWLYGSRLREELPEYKLCLEGQNI